MVRYNFTLAVTRNTKKIAANELDLLLVLVRLLHNRKHKAASKPERPGIPASACACRQITLPNRILAKISLPVLMQDTHKTKNLNFGCGMRAI